MTDFEQLAVNYFCNPGQRVEPLPLRADGSVDYENLCGEFCVEGVPVKKVRFYYELLPAELKRNPDLTTEQKVVVYLYDKGVV